jgi:hypothetical protein
VSHEGTTSVDYGQTPYDEVHLGGDGDYSWDDERWRAFFLSAAGRLVGALSPATVLDVGCAKGLLVQSFMVQGVDAHGIDISSHAIAGAHEEVRDRLSVASATEPIDGHYDLVTCIEVLEHMSGEDVQLAIDHMTAVTDRVLFSSSPTTTNPSEQWAAWFAERGFFRRVDVDVSLIAPWAVVFERGEPTLHDLTRRYEQQYARVRTELDRLRDEAAHARHAVLVNRDHVIGLEAQNGRLQRDLSLVTLELKKTQRRIKGLARRREELTAKLLDTRQRLERSRKRVAELERTPATKASLTRRVARRVRRTFA